MPVYLEASCTASSVWIFGAAAFFAVPGASVTTVRSAQEAGGGSCEAFLLAPREVKGKKVGPSSCSSRESRLSLDGREFVRLDIGLDGTVDGFVTKTGDYKEYLTNAPDLVFPQTADDGERLFAVAKYERDKGAAMTIVYPRDRSAWNGKMWVTVHGRGASFKEGQLKAWNKNPRSGRPAEGPQQVRPG